MRRVGAHGSFLVAVGPSYGEGVDGVGSERVWYVAYGSNLCRDRLMAYLEGTPIPPALAATGDGPGSRATRYGQHRGCADPTPPAEDRWLELGHRVTFRGRSRRWGGGVAFLDLVAADGGRCEVRAWLLTVAQVRGVAAQEAGLPTDPEPSVVEALTEVGATAKLGGGWYDTLLRLPDIDGRPALAVTTGQDLPVTVPTEPYLATIAAGRSERPVGGSRRRDSPAGGRHRPVGGSAG
ncbi:hypothetical protein BH24ACT4_BH24ACT4_19030 [soil metagenome]